MKVVDQFSLLIWLLLIVSKVKYFRYGVGLDDVKYGHAILLSVNKQPIC